MVDPNWEKRAKRLCWLVLFVCFVGSGYLIGDAVFYNMKFAIDDCEQVKIDLYQAIRFKYLSIFFRQDSFAIDIECAVLVLVELVDGTCF